MANELIINASLPEIRIALVEDGEIQELLIERASDKGIVGNIYKGRVTRVLPGMQAAFVDIGLDKAAFLYVDDVFVHPGDWEEGEDRRDSLRGESSESKEESDELESSSHDRVNAPIAEAVSEGVQVQTEGQSEGSSSREVLASDVASERGMVRAESTQMRQRETTYRVAPRSPSRLNPSDAHLTRSSARRESLHSAEASDSEPQHEKAQEQDLELLPEDEDEDEDEFDPLEEDRPVDMAEAPRRRKSPTGRAPRGTLGAPRKAKLVPSVGEVPPAAVEAEGADPQSTPRASETPKTGRRPRRTGGASRTSAKASFTAEVSKTPEVPEVPAHLPTPFHQQLSDGGELESDRSGMLAQSSPEMLSVTNRPEESATPRPLDARPLEAVTHRQEFNAPRSRDRRIRQKATIRSTRAPVNIQDLLKEGQEVLVQVAKDPIATKGARVTCHLSLPGRHLVCMPTIDHVGVSRRIERDEERRRLREFVQRNRPKGLGFIVRTAGGKQQSEKRLKQDIDYLNRLWSEVRERLSNVTAPALVYEDLNAVLRSIRDWVTEEIDKVVVDSKNQFNEIQHFVSYFMPSLKQKVELYQGDIPVFDAYGISTEISRSLERKVWLKSGGYIVIDQAEALVAIDVNTGRYVGKKNLEDTILKTNLEAVQEIAYQLRLRNCGGIIILDFIDMDKEENKHRVYRALEDALARDRARPSILKISQLGLVEMTRKRTRDTIVRSLCESCLHCEGKGFIKSKLTVAYEAMREIEREGLERDVAKILVQAHAEVIDILAIDERDSLDQLERKFRKQIYLQAVADFHPEQFEVSADRKDRRIRPRDREQEIGPERHQERPRNTDLQSPRRGEASPIAINLGTESTFPATLEPRIVINPVITPKAPRIVEDSQEAFSALVIGAKSRESEEDCHMGNASPLTGVAVASSSALDQADHAYEEEDRLAYLRAQAAQDAALARLGGNHAVHLQHDLANRAPHPRRGPTNDPNYSFNQSPGNHARPRRPHHPGGTPTGTSAGNRFRRGAPERAAYGPSRGPKTFGFKRGPKGRGDQRVDPDNVGNQAPPTIFAREP